MTELLIIGIQLNPSGAWPLCHQVSLLNNTKTKTDHTAPATLKLELNLKKKTLPGGVKTLVSTKLHVGMLQDTQLLEYMNNVTLHPVYM